MPKQKVVGQQQYPDSIIEFCVTIAYVYHLRLRQVVGFVKSLFRLLQYDLPIPDYSTLSRRMGKLVLQVSNTLGDKENIRMAIDSTGLKLMGEGEWKVRQHGLSKRRSWKKLHIAIDVNTQEMVSVKLTSNSVHDAKAAVSMVADIRKETTILACGGDGAYDDFKFRAVLGNEVEQLIPHPVDAVIQEGTDKDPLPDYLLQRNEAVTYCQTHTRKEWKQKVGYHTRSLCEVGMFRYKITFDATLQARTDDNQAIEVLLKCKILNKFRSLGMPDTLKVA